MLKRFISYYKPHKKMLALDMIAALLISLIGMVYPIVTNNMLNEYIPNKMYTTVIPRSVRVAEAPSFGRTIMEHDRFGSASMAYQAVAREFIARHR